MQRFTRCWLNSLLYFPFYLCIIVGCLCLSYDITQALPIRIGMVIAFSGQAAGDNLPASGIAQTAVEEINSRGGVLGRPLELLELDNRSTPIGSKLAAEKAVQAGVSAVIGALWSSHSKAMVPVLEAARIPMISPTSTAPDLTIGKDYIFRMCFTDSFEGQMLARFAREDLRAGTAGILVNLDEDYSGILADAFSQAFIQAGGEILFRSGYLGDASDFNQILAGLEKLNPNVILLPGYAQDSGLIIRQARSIGIKSIFLGGDGWEPIISDYAGRGLLGSYYGTHWHSIITTPPGKEISTNSKDGQEAAVNSGVKLTYDAVYLLADAIERAGSDDPGEIRSALAKTAGFQGVTGPITFNADGDPLDKPVVIMKYGNNGWEFVKSFNQLSQD